MKQLPALIAALMLVVGAALPAWGQVCKPTSVQSIQVKLQYLRRLSIDLRGKLPTIEEAQQVIQAGEVPSSLVDKWLKSETVYEQIRHYHRDLLWANIGSIELNRNWRINKGKGTAEDPYWSTYLSGSRGGEVGCLNKPAETNADGTFKTEPAKEDPSWKQEGYVKIKPYWSDKEVYVCAFDAMGTKQGGEGPCGPNLRNCQSDDAGTSKMLTSALIEQTLRFAEQTIRGDKPYTDVITAKRTIVNGPIAHLLKYQADKVDGVQIGNLYDLKKLPELSFNADKDKWVSLDVSTKHSGILTMPLYLLKYTSNRSRASEFYTKMLCKPFQAPPGGLPPGSDPCHAEPNLMKRCGCKYCHQSLEPAAAYWGRWLQSSVLFLEPSKYPSFKQECSSTRPDRNKCGLYFTNATHPDQEKYRGKLKSYLFSTDKMGKNIELGPAGIAKEAIETNTFSRCTTRKVWNWFVGSPEPAPELLEVLASKFRESNYNFRSLMKSILTHKSYSQGRLYQVTYK